MYRRCGARGQASEIMMSRISKGYRMMGGKAFLLNGTVSGYDAEDAKKKAKAEATRIRKQGNLVRLVKVCSIQYMIYQFSTKE